MSTDGMIMRTTLRRDGGPVYPQTHDMCVEGASLRDYFAAAALSLTTSECNASEESTCDGAAHARQAYVIADAMLAERAKKDTAS